MCHWEWLEYNFHGLPDSVVPLDLSPSSNVIGTIRLSWRFRALGFSAVKFDLLLLRDDCWRIWNFDHSSRGWDTCLNSQFLSCFDGLDSFASALECCCDCSLRKRLDSPFACSKAAVSLMDNHSWESGGRIDDFLHEMLHLVIVY